MRPANELVLRAGPADSDPGLGALQSLYVDPDAWGTGIGSALHDAAAEALAADFEGAELWVIQGNTRTRRFYEHRGWQEAGAFMRTREGLQLVRYVRWLR